ncbi:hemagglutinin repeat-containing protein [Gallibacterium trehalosifermentans]|uniref:Hemagglutinin repeat-containing protein n=1 Tax=Gallibacterium trehalosifermentans TaxID=516935 RepID=A0ABV6H004_9PAST
MNKHCYRIIFNRLLQRFVVVSEITTKTGKAPQSGNRVFTNLSRMLIHWRLPPLMIGLYSLLGVLAVSSFSASAVADELQIRADSQAPKSQQPIVLQTANGLPQVNIQTPNDKGLSHNKYQQFDVNTRGAILNNSRKNVKTEQGGWVQANPYLVGGEAKVILNEVNASKPSQLKGYIEVAGSKAEVIIANPNGIHCEGCGFINAGRSTMTTGQVQIENGQVKGYRVEQGEITVSGRGLDSHRQDYTEIIAKEVKVNAGIWANQLTVTTGQNQVPAQSTKNASSLQVIRGSEVTASQGYAVDVAELGGMYANQIHLIGTESGLGVRNAGHIGAAAGDVVIDSQGQIINSGYIGAKQNVSLTAPTIKNQQAGQLVATKKLTAQAHSLNNQTGFIHAEQTDITLQHQLNNQATGSTGALIKAKQLHITTPRLLNQQTKAQHNTPTQGLIAETLAIHATHWFNQSGGAYSQQAINATITDTLNNQQGELLSLNSLALRGDNLQLENTQGIIASQGDLTFQLAQWENIGQVKSAANANITIHHHFRLDTPLFIDGMLNLKVNHHFTNQTQLITGQGLTIQAASITNPQQSELSAQKTQLHTDTLLNQGLIDGSKTVIVTNQLTNLGSGRIYGNHLAIQATHLNNLPEQEQAATIAARERLDLGVGTLTNYDHALILSQGDLFIGGELDRHAHATGQATFIDNGSATIEALGNGNMNTQRLWNHDLHLLTGEHHQDQRISEYALNHKSQRYSSLEGWFNRNNNHRKDRNSYFHFNDGRPRIAGPTWVQWHFNRHTITTTLVHRDPAKILIAGNLRLNGENLLNEVSHIQVGKHLRMGGRLFKQNEQHLNLKGNGVRLENKDLIGEIHRHDKGTWYTMVTKRKRRGVGKKVWAKYGGEDIPFSRDLPIEYFKFHLVDNRIGQPIQATNSEIHQQSTAQHAAILPVQLDTLHASLYRINHAPDSHVLIETDPRFTHKKTWLGSDYMFDALRADPQMRLKRLGDGYYEQRLINEQINQLTGQRFLGNYTSDYEQYKALMDAGIRYAKAHNLMPGVTLSAAQMQALTEDMVWLEPQTVTLKDGKQVNVLVPQVYLVKRDIALHPTGAIISAQEITVESAGDIKNSGQLVARQSAHLAAHTLENSGSISAEQLNFTLANRFYQQGGQLKADTLQLNAKTIHLEGRMSEANSNANYARRQLDEQAVLHIKQALILQSQGDIQLNATSISAGSALLKANGNLHIGTVTETERSHYIANSENYWTLKQQQEIGSRIEIKDNAVFSGKQGVTLRAATINTGGDIIVNSEQGDIQLQAGRHQETLDFATKYKDKSLLSRTTTTIKHAHQYDLAESSQLTGNNIALQATHGTIAVEGGAVVSDNAMQLQAQDIAITAAHNIRQEYDYYAKKKSGLMSSGGIGFTIGSRKESTDTNYNLDSTLGSQLGSLQSNVSFIATEHYQQQSSRITAGKGDINIQAKQIDITADKDKSNTHYRHTLVQNGLTLGVNIPVVQAVQQVQQTAKTAKQVGDAKDNRINALAAINTSFDLANTAEVAGNVANSVANQGAQGLTNNIGISITYGKQKNEQTTFTETITANSSKINAAGNAMLLTTADKDTSHITVKGSEVIGQQGTTIATAGNLIIEAQQQTYKERSKNKSSGWNAGVAINYGSNGFAFGITAGGNYGKGYGNGDETTWATTLIGHKQSQTTLISGEDMTIRGGQVIGQGVSVQANNLTITSLQDTATYESKQKQLSAQVTVGYGASFSGSYNQSKINADYASVNQQSGIFAGDEGFKVEVNQHTDLQGGLVTSTELAEQQGKNRFTTGTLTYKDIQNHSNYSAKGFGLSGGISISGGHTPKEIEGVKLQQIGQNQKNGSSNVEFSGIAGVASQGNWGIAKGLTTALLGQVNHHDNEDGVTTSAINTTNIHIRHDNEQKSLTGQTTKETAIKINKANIHQAVTKANIENIKSDLDRDLTIATAFMKNINVIGDDIYYNIEKKEGNILIKEKRMNKCESIACIQYHELDFNNLEVPKTKEEAEVLSRMYAHGIMNTSDMDRLKGAIQYGGKDYLDNDVLVVIKPFTSIRSELTFTIFERLRAGLNMPSIFGASNASREQVKIWNLLEEYNRNNPNDPVSLKHLAHSLGVSSTKNAMNWASYQGTTFTHTTLDANTIGTSYPMTNNTFGGRLSMGLYDQGYSEKASELFRDGSVAYAVAPRDIVATGIGLPFVPGSLSLGIGNTDTTGSNSTGIPLWDLITGHHTKAYYRDEESIRFLNTDRERIVDLKKIKEIETYQKRIWGKIGPRIEKIEFNNKDGKE